MTDSARAAAVAHDEFGERQGELTEDLARGHGPGWLENWLHRHGQQVVRWRRTLHAHPELSWQEHRTTQWLAERLRELGLSPRSLPGGTGLVCDIGSGAPCMVLRADIDALPLTEITELPFRSTVEGVAHCCGHDAHTAVLLGAAAALRAGPDLPGTVRLLFQPAEETMPGGALSVLDSSALNGAERIFGLHCDPRLPVGTVGVKTGPMTSAADLVEVQLTSPGGHTSRPHLTADLVYAMGAVITGLPGLVSRRVDPRSGTVLTWGAANAGDAANAIPRKGLLRGTVRTGDRGTWGILEPLVRDAVTSLLAATGVGFDLVYRRGVPPVVNEVASTRVLREAVVAALGDSGLTGTEQSSGGEDFGWYLEKLPGAFARLGVASGSGAEQDLHQPGFTLDERALLVGVRTMVQLAYSTGPDPT